MLRIVRLVLGVGLVIFIASAAYSQQAAEQPELSAEPLYEQVNVLWIARTVPLSGEQISEIIPKVQAIGEARQQLLSEADTYWQAHQDAIEQVLQRWIAGTPPPTESLARAEGAGAKFRQGKAQLEALIATSVEQILWALRPDQRHLVESWDQQQQRQQLSAELGGVDSLAEYIVQQLETQRELMPDEYGLVRVVEGRRLAAMIVDPRAPAYGELVRTILQLTDTVYNWPQPQYNAEYPALAEQVARLLNLPAPTAARRISYDELVSFVSSPYTGDLLQQISPEAQGESATVARPVRSLADHPLQVAVEKSDLLAVLNDLQLWPQQLQRLLPLAQQAAQATQKAEKMVGDKYTELEATFQQAYQTLLVSSEVPPELESGLAALRQTREEARHQQQVDIASILRQVQRILVPEQNALIDWQPPAAVIAVSPQEKAAQQRQIAAEMARTIQFMERQRYIAPEDYAAIWPQEAEQYLSKYVDPASPRFPECRRLVDSLLDVIEGVRDDEWAHTAPHLAARLLEDIGVIPMPGRRQPSARPLNWEVVYEVFANPATPDLLQKMLQLRSVATW